MNANICFRFLLGQSMKAPNSQSRMAHTKLQTKKYEWNITKSNCLYNPTFPKMTNLKRFSFSTAANQIPDNITIEHAAKGGYVPVIRFPGEPLSDEQKQILRTEAVKNVHNMLSNCLMLKPEERLLVIFDKRHELTSILADGYLEFAKFAKKKIVFRKLNQNSF